MKLIALTSAILMAGLSSVSSAMEPPKAPSVYNNGPTSPVLATTNLSASERAAYALMETIIMVAKAKIHATGCGSTAGTYPVTVQANGEIRPDLPTDNKATITSLGASYELDADLYPSNFRGQKVEVSQPANGVFDGRKVQNTFQEGFYNAANNMLVMSGTTKVQGNNGRLDTYQSSLIKDFYRGSVSDNGDGEFYLIYDWGLEALSKLGYPVNKYWQRSKSRRDDGVNGRTVFVQDRLVGTSKCRILIDTDGTNGEELFWQTGNLIVESVKPSEAVTEFTF